jgi:MFS family permease
VPLVRSNSGAAMAGSTTGDAHGASEEDGDNGTVAGDPDALLGTPPDEPPAEQEIAPDIARPISLLAVFRHRNYRLFFAGQFVSLMGSWMQNTAQPWLVDSMTHSPWLLGVTSFCSTVPVFFLTPFGGMVAERVDRRKFLLVTQSAAMVQATLLAGLTLMGWVKVWEIICLALTMGLINAFDIPSRQAMTLDMVGRGDLRHAISLNSMMFNATRVLGPVMAGFVIHFWGEGWCFALNAASFGAVLFSLYFMQLKERPPRINQHALKEIADGYRYSFATPAIRMSLLLVAVSSLFGAAFVTMMPAVVRELLHGDSTTQGTLMASVGAGALVGAFFLSRVTERQLVYAPVISGAVLGLGLVAFAHSHHLWLSVAILLPVSTSLMLLGGTANTIIQMMAHENFRGRVISHYTQSFMGMIPWGALLLGALAHTLGVTWAISIGGAVVAASAVAAFLHRRATGFTVHRAAMR